jgi:hypothetical protein
MTDPTNFTDEQREQRRTRDELVRAAGFATDMFVMDHRAELERVTSVSYTRLTLQAAIGYLIGQGLIRATPEDQRPEWLEMQIPDHLQPDLTEAMAELARINASLRGGRS